MPLDTSIYQNVRPVEMPSVMDSAQKAATLSSLAMSQRHAARQMANEDRKMAREEEAFKQANDLHKLVNLTMPAMSALAGMPEPERAKAYPQVMKELAAKGVPMTNVPQDSSGNFLYDPGHFGQSYSFLKNTDEYLKRDLLKSQIKKNYADAEKEKALASAKGNNPNKYAFDQLPVENQEQVKDLAKKTASKKSIKNQIDAAFIALSDPTVSEDQKIKTGQTLLKVLNSTEGQDAVGAEESRRLGSFLEYKIGNITQPGSFVGRDLDKFIEQVRITSNNIGEAIQKNTQDVDSLYGRPATVSVNMRRMPSKPDGSGIPGVETASAGTLKRKVSSDEVDQYATKYGMTAKAAREHLRSQGYDAN